ncbi:MAG: uroporphyrinogen-III C-methyltransferase, partial [Candidatus Hodarchaeota archaeon]
MVVYLVGVGPEADLLTLRGAKLIENAEVIIYTELGTRDILKLAKNPNCEILDAGKDDKDTQRKLVANYFQGERKKLVVRLIQGDPFSSLEGTAEVQYLVQNNIPFEIVPGVMSLLSALSMAGI